jgi:hypothetical protein
MIKLFMRESLVTKGSVVIYLHPYNIPIYTGTKHFFTQKKGNKFTFCEVKDGKVR